MNRKQFINVTSKALLGIVLANSLFLSCSSENFEVKNIIGKDKSILKNLDIEYDGKFSCYSNEKFNNEIEGIKLFVFCIENKIVGMSIKTKYQSISDKFSDQIKKYNLVFDNAFGTKESWKEGSIFKSLCISKDYGNIDGYIFYSEYLEEAKPIIW